ncbi:MAG: glycosyltransferase family 4 protein [Armatimonadota bacterium]|nr:glycosyltransferase family 4 protein [Armatimonadota bacterium]
MRRLILVYAGDFAEYPMGGVLEYTKNFARYAPVELYCVGITTNPTQPLRQWTTVNIKSVERPFLPLLFVDDAKQRRSKIPLNFKFLQALKRQKAELLRLGGAIYIQRAEHGLAFMDDDVPLFFNTHGQSAFFERWTTHPLFRWRAFRKWFMRMEARVIARAQGVFTISPADYEYYVGKFPTQAHKIHYTPLGIEIDEYTPPATRANGAPHILFVGRLDASKGLDLLIAGFARFHQRYPEAVLTIVGGSHDYNPVEAEVRRAIETHGVSDAVRLTGLLPRAAILPYYHQADVFVLTSLWEGLPTALLEAMACGVPAVVTNVGGMPAVVRDDENGYVLTERDPAQLATLIERAWRNRARLSLAARRTAENYSIQAHARRVCELMGLTPIPQPVAQELVC